MTEPEYQEGSAGHGPAESAGSRPGGYPEFPPLPTERLQPQAPDPEGAGPEAFDSGGTAPAPAAAGTFALAETHPQPAVLPGFELDPDTQPGAPAGSWPHRMRLGFRAWRRSRPFWGGLFVVLGGGEILFSEKAPLRVIVHFGLTGLAGYLIPSVMVLCGVLIIFNPAQRLFYAILSVLLALATWPTSNLGGFLVGMLLGLIGGSLGFAWMPLSQTPAPKAAKPKAAKRKPPKAAAHG